MKIRYLSKRNLFLLLMALVMTAGLTVSVVFSRFTSDLQESTQIDIKEFYAAARLYTQDQQGQKVEIPLHTEGGLQYYDLTIDQLQDLKMDLSYIGSARTRLRFKLDISWFKYVTADGEQKEQLIFHKYPLLQLPDQIYNNVERDNWIYVKDILQSDETTEITIPAILSFEDQGDLEDPVSQNDISTHIRIFVTIDCVQFNRALALWKIDRFPWVPEETPQDPDDP